MTAVYILLGCLFLIVWQAIIIANAFSNSFLWWIACLFTPLAIIYIFINWKEVKGSGFLVFLGIIFLHIGWMF